jgi:hypothetical protein
MNLRQNEEEAERPLLAGEDFDASTTSTEVVATPKAAAASQLQPLNQAEHEAFLSRLQEQIQQQKRRYRRLIGVYFVGVLAYLVGTFANLAHLIPQYPWGILISLMPIAYVIALFASQAVGKRWQNTAAQLAETEDPRYIGPLIEACMSINVERVNGQASPAREALIRRLPQLRADETHLINSQQRQLLNRFLAGNAVWYGGNVRLAVAILQAYEQVGDSAALPIVERLAAGERGGMVRAVREAAQQCLIFLRPRAEAEQANQQLLRASDGNATPTDVLLRPVASSSQETDPQQLLRAEGRHH